MKLSYFDLLSPDPVVIPNACSVISPKLREIASTGFAAYQYYLSLLFMNVKAYFDLVGCSEEYEKLAGTELAQINLFGLLTANEKMALLLQSALQFFIQEKVIYSKKDNCFLICDEAERRIGIISQENYALVCDVIRQRNHFRSAAQEDLSKVKSKKALEIAKKLQQGRARKEASGKPDDNMELGNIISAVANKSQSLNILNIWDLTVFQLWDCFFRLSNNSIYAIQSMSVAAWGDKDKHFDAAAWFKKINQEP